MSENNTLKLYRVYTHTQGDESITERLVSATGADDAQSKALTNVKAQNVGKGRTDQEDSQNNTTILSIKECGRNGVLCTNRFPLSSLSNIYNSLSSSGTISEEVKDFRKDINQLLGLNEDASMEESVKVLEAIVGRKDKQPLNLLSLINDCKYLPKFSKLSICIISSNLDRSRAIEKYYCGVTSLPIHHFSIEYFIKNWKTCIRGKSNLAVLIDCEIYDSLMLLPDWVDINTAITNSLQTSASMLDVTSESLIYIADV